MALQLVLAGTPRLKSKPSDGSKVLCFEVTDSWATDALTCTNDSVKIIWMHDVERCNPSPLFYSPSEQTNEHLLVIYLVSPDIVYFCV